MGTVFVQFIYLYCNVTDLWAMYFGRANFNAKSGMISPARTTNVFWVKTLVGCTPVVAQLYCIETLHAANTVRRPSAGLLVDQRLRRWPNIKPSLV